MSQENSRLLLGGQQLFESRGAGNRLAAAAPSCKTVAPEQREGAISEHISTILAQMNVARTKSRGSIGQAEWLVDRQLALITRSRGSLGFSEDGARFLTPYETVSVIESQEYEVTLHGLPLSQEEAYSTCLSNERDFDVYRVYSGLLRQGLHVWKRDTKVCMTGDVRSAQKEAAKRQMRDMVPIHSFPDVKRRRINKHPNPSASSNDLMLEVADLKLALVRHREFVVPPVHDHLKANAKDWKEYKEINCCLDQSFVGRVVHLPDELSNEISQRLPSSILSSGVTKSINRFAEVSSLTDLCTKLQDHGPRTFFRSRAPDLLSEVVLHFKAEEEENGNVVVAYASEPLPSQRLIYELSRDAVLIVAVIDESLITYFRFSSVNHWQQLPRLWLKHVD